MRVDRDRLIFLALAVLKRAALDTQDAAGKPGAEVRLALAVLFACSRSGEREPYDHFWRCLRDPYPKESSDTLRGIQRKQDAFGLLRQMTRDVGAPEHGDYQSKISDLVIGPVPHPWRPGSAVDRPD